MRPTIFFFAIAIAIPITIEIEEANHLEKRGMDTAIADIVKAIITFGGFIWDVELSIEGMWVIIF